tara:strand:+ start:8972 stop:10894 length:1923 start_codon:yes stop_codon:yes gene_type:complete
MCGICGAINLDKKNKKVSIKNIEIIRKQIASRGPDAKGYWTNKNKDLIVAIHRLATQDTSPTANQPLYSQDKNVITIMNGEIYNHNYLKKILEKKGYSFKSKNDTEVIANSFHYWGKKFLNKLEGQFALFVYNIKKNEGLLARDEHGISPLYYSIKNDRLFFSSTETSINSQINKRITLNNKTVSDFIISGSSTKDNTIFKNIKQLQPGKYILFNTNKKVFKPKTFKIFNPKQKLKKRLSLPKSQKKILSILYNKVYERASGNKNVGVFLSGGVDSTLILALLKKINPQKKIITFTASFESIKNRELIGEQKIVKKICKYYKCKNIIVPIKSKDLIENMGTYSSPETGILEYCNRALSKAAKLKGVDVILSGEGSDEMFLGYDHNLSIIGIINKEFSYLKNKYKLRSNVNLSNLKKLKIEDLFLIGGADIDLENNRKKIFKKPLQREESFKETISKYIKKYRLRNSKDFNKIAFLLDYEIKIPNIQLRRSEGPSMAEGVEMRFPFLNYDLKKTVYSSPLSYKIKKTLKDKVLLRDSVKSLIPKYLFTEKMPFGVPATRKKYFLKSKNKFNEPALGKLLHIHKNQIFKDIEKSSIIKSSFIKKKYLELLKKKQNDKKNSFFDPVLFRIWSLSKWYKLQFNK